MSKPWDWEYFFKKIIEFLFNIILDTLMIFKECYIFSRSHKDLKFLHAWMLYYFPNCFKNILRWWQSWLLWNVEFFLHSLVWTFFKWIFPKYNLLDSFYIYIFIFWLCFVLFLLCLINLLLQYLLNLVKCIIHLTHNDLFKKWLNSK